MKYKAVVAILLQNLICNNNLDNATININVNLSK